MKSLLDSYKKKKIDIRNRLQEFQHVYKRGDKDIFAELCFCILTPQAKAVICDQAIKRLQRHDLLFKGSQGDVRRCLKGVRFPNNKARYLVEARKCSDLKAMIDTKDLIRARDWLVKNIKGLGYKEASHFLRNIGFGQDLAILDRHILKNLKRYGIIKKIPESLTKKEYIKIENKMREFFQQLNIPLDEIDLLFWSTETGIIFK
ncbi:MAG: N-glycosylase/DNA lyase [Candidatus Gorgyraea atricola]|nr:N-glycosylase/DNA lyase [Candidatus Gorgyraea atricola]